MSCSCRCATRTSSRSSAAAGRSKIPTCASCANRASLTTLYRAILYHTTLYLAGVHRVRAVRARQPAAAAERDRRCSSPRECPGEGQQKQNARRRPLETPRSGPEMSQKEGKRRGPDKKKNMAGASASAQREKPSARGSLRYLGPARGGTCSKGRKRQFPFVPLIRGLGEEEGSR